MLLQELTLFCLLINILPAPSLGATIKEDESFLQNLAYLNQEYMEDAFAHLQKNYPELVRVENIGRSLERRNLLVLKIGRHSAQRNLLTPPVKFIGNMHGDETVGRQLLIYLAQYLLYNYDKSLEIATLVNTTDIYIMPTMNPDGFARSQEGNCESLPHYVGRTNAAGVDLNRDFPDRLDDQFALNNRARARQPETAAVVEWILKNPFVLSANFHGGAVVASYPFDNSISHHECCEESLTPDDRVFKLMAHTYADNNPLMRKGNNCNDTFKDGITNGANWYELNGGMQDFNYAFSNCFELTIELSCCKYPSANELPAEWARNKRSMLNLLKLAHIGIKGVVTDHNGYPIRDATILVAGLENKSVRTTERGEYWRLLTPGIYSVQVAAFGYKTSAPQDIHVSNERNEALRFDFELSPAENNYDGTYHKLKVERAEPATESNYGFLTPVKFQHHNYTAMTKFLHNIADSFPSITRLYSIGKSIEQRELWVMEIHENPGEHVPGVPEFKYVANMHGNEVVGREMLLLLTKYMCENYLNDDRITKLINTTRMHFLYSMNPDGYEKSTEGDRTSLKGRGNAKNVDLNRNFPDQYGTDKYNRVMEPEVAAVIKWTLSIPFVLSANLHGGSLVANYPFDDNEKDFMDPVTRLRDATIKGRRINPTEDNELFRHLALTYSQAHPTMHLGKPCPLFKKENFTDGITNGAKWYSVTGGMQDWNYVRAGVLELTIEMGCDKFPMASELPKYWQDNREPLLKFIEQIHYGAHGFVRSSISSPISGAAITLDHAKHAVYSSTHGDYWKLALPGRHNVTILANGYTPQREEIEIPENGERAIRLDITLMRDDPQHWASANDFRIIENVVKTTYHNNADIRAKMAQLENQNGQIAAFGYAESEFGFYFNSLKLTADIGAPEEEKYKILVVSSFTNTAAPLGREIIMNLARHIVEGYKIREPPILRLLQNSVVHLLPITENFDEVIDIYNLNENICDPVVPNSIGEQILSPESDTRRDLFLEFLSSENFDLILTFSSGNSDLIYPKNDEIYEKLAHNIENTEFNFSPLHCNGSSTRTVQHTITSRLTQLVENMYQTPMYTLGLSCCGMPPQSEIGSVWSRNLDKLKNFMQLMETGVMGRIHNAKGEQLREAFVKLRHHKPIFNVTKNAAHFRIILPEGEYELEISATNYETKVQSIKVIAGRLLDVGIIALSPIQIITGHSEMINFPSPTTSTTTITGFVLDESNHPISGAKVSLLEPLGKHFMSNYTDNLGTYSLSNIPFGNVTLQVEASRYLEKVRVLRIEKPNTMRGVVFRLKANEKVFGLPRFLFIIFASIMGIIGVVGCLFCGQCIYRRSVNGDKHYYNFSLLPQKGLELFEDGDDGETELFKSPIKRGMAIKPYYDKVIIPSLTESEEEDDFDDDDYDNNSDVAVMFDKRTH